MQWSTLTFLALSMRVAAQATDGFDVMTVPETQKTYTIGSSLPITWTPSSPAGSISLTLIGGATSNGLNPIIKIASGIDSTLGTYSWLIPDTAGAFATYGINLTSDANPNTFQYSNAFHISGGSTTGSSSSSSSTTGSSSTSASASTSTSTTTVASSTSTVVSTSTTEAGTSSISASTTGTGSGTTTKPTTLASSTKTSSGTSTSSNGTSTGTAAPSATGNANAGDVIVNSKFALLGGLLVALAL